MNRPSAILTKFTSFTIDFCRRRWIHILLLTVPAYIFRNAINPDGIAYIQVAKHWIAGEPSLAITGYWGPLFSWLLMPLFILEIPDLIACRILMIFSSLVFLESAKDLVKITTISSAGSKAIDNCLALACLLWSVENITPDLLLAAIFLKIIKIICDSKWIFSPKSSLNLGFTLSLAYLCKSVALPVSIIFLLIVLLSWKWMYPDRKLVGQRCLITFLLPWTLICGSWIAVLSMHYGKLTFSTSARIVHATVGPGDIQRYPIGFDIGEPESGRITQWEDPKLEESQYWNPFKSLSNFQHQCRLIVANLAPALIIHTSLFLFSIPVIFYVIPSILSTRRNSWTSPKSWRGVVLCTFVSILTGIYMMTLLPASEQRYFYALPPILAVLCFELLKLRCFETKKHLLTLIICISIILPSIGRWILLPPVKISAFEQAMIASHHIRLAPELTPGPIVGNARLRRGRSGLFLAYFLNQKWYGGNPESPLESLIRSKADYVVLANNDFRLPRAMKNPLLEDVSSADAPLIKIFKIKLN